MLSTIFRNPPHWLPLRVSATLILSLLLLVPLLTAAQSVMTNGVSYEGTISAAIKSNSYQFTASAGDNISVGTGEITQRNGNFYPRLFLYGPDGALLASDYDSAGAYVSSRATKQRHVHLDRQQLL